MAYSLADSYIALAEDHRYARRWAKAQEAIDQARRFPLDADQRRRLGEAAARLATDRAEDRPS